MVSGLGCWWAAVTFASPSFYCLKCGGSKRALDPPLVLLCHLSIGLLLLHQEESWYQKRNKDYGWLL